MLFAARAAYFFAACCIYMLYFLLLLLVVVRVARIMLAKSPVKAKVMNAYFVKLARVCLNELIEVVNAAEFGIYMNGG